MQTLDSVVRTKKAHCLEAALSAVAILEYHGYAPLILDLESTDYLDHTLFLYKQNNRYGSVGMSRDVGLYGRKPVFKTIRALAMSYAAPYIDEHACLKSFGVLDLRTLNSDAWRNSKNNVWYVEEALRNIPHQKLHLPKTFVSSWRLKFIEWKKLHPEKQPNYFAQTQTWM